MKYLLLILIFIPFIGCSQLSIPFDGKQRVYNVNTKKNSQEIFCYLTPVSGRVISFKFIAKQGAMIGFKTFGIYNMYWWITGTNATGGECGQDVVLVETKNLSLVNGNTYTINLFIQSPYNLKAYVVGLNYFKY